MKKTICAWIALLCCQFVTAQQENLLNLQVEARVDYQRDYVAGNTVKEDCGFKGKYLNIRVDGNLTSALSYSYRQRLNKSDAGQSFFDATDWLYIDYRASEHWSFSAGKQVVAIGGYEYDRAPIDLYFCSEFWNNIPCYEMGVSVTYSPNGGKDKLLAQLCQSPFDLPTEDLYAYNLMWYGNHGRLSTAYSANLIEYGRGRFITYLALGHKLDVTDRLSVEVDVMNRATRHQTYFLKDCSVMGELSYRPTERWNLFGKVTYDVNRTDQVADYCVLPGTEVTRMGAGVEFYPLPHGNKSLRLHLNGCYTWGRNGNENGALRDEQALFDAGISWKMNLLSFKKK